MLQHNDSLVCVDALGSHCTGLTSLTLPLLYRYQCRTIQWVHSLVVCNVRQGLSSIVLCHTHWWHLSISYMFHCISWQVYSAGSCKLYSSILPIAACLSTGICLCLCVDRLSICHSSVHLSIYLSACLTDWLSQSVHLSVVGLFVLAQLALSCG